MKKVITGFHAIEEILKAEKNRREKDSGTAKKNCAQPLEISCSKQGPRVKRILELAVRLGINVRQEEDGALDGYVGHLPNPLKDHRGVILFLETDGAGGQPSADEFFAAQAAAAQVFKSSQKQAAGQPHGFRLFPYPTS